MPLTREELVEAFRTMRLIRAFEEAIRRLHGAGELPGFMHVSVGQEAVPVGISLRLRRDDLITTTHRGHGDMIAKGAAVEGMIARSSDATAGCAGPRVGRCTWPTSRSARSGPTASSQPACRSPSVRPSRSAPGHGPVVVAYNGDGALANGAAHEALNMASLWRVPVIFARVEQPLRRVDSGRGLPRDAGRRALRRGLRPGGRAGRRQRRRGGGRRRGSAPWSAAAPARARRSCSCETYRRYGHNIGDTGKARPDEEVEHWLARDPVDLLAARLTGAHGIAADELERMGAEQEARMEAAIAAARAMPEPPEAWAFEDVHADADVIAAIGGGLR